MAEETYLQRAQKEVQAGRMPSWADWSHLGPAAREYLLLQALLLKKAGRQKKETPGG